MFSLKTLDTDSSFKNDTVPIDMIYIYIYVWKCIYIYSHEYHFSKHRIISQGHWFFCQGVWLDLDVTQLGQPGKLHSEILLPNTFPPFVFWVCFFICLMKSRRGGGSEKKSKPWLESRKENFDFDPIVLHLKAIRKSPEGLWFEKF